MLDTTLQAAIQADPQLRGRIRSVVMSQRWNEQSDNGAALTSEPPIDAIAWAVATSPVVFAKIKAAFETDPANQVAAAAIMTGCSDEDLTPLVAGALTRLAG